ncbi:MAG: hypothetical protein KVP17_004002, partial [Porospora cf. gigantea B]
MMTTISNERFKRPLSAAETKPMIEEASQPLSVTFFIETKPVIAGQPLPVTSFIETKPVIEAWNVSYRGWPDANHLSEDAPYVIGAVTQLFIEAHTLVPLVGTHKAELLEFIDFLSDQYKHKLFAVRNVDFYGVRDTLELDVELSSAFDYTAFLDAEGDFIRNVRGCMQVDVDECWTRLAPGFVGMQREYLK